MLIESNDPRTVSVMNLLQHLNTQELKDLLNEDARFETIIKDSDCVSYAEIPKSEFLQKSEFSVKGEATRIGKRYASCQQQIPGRV